MSALVSARNLSVHSCSAALWPPKPSAISKHAEHAADMRMRSLAIGPPISAIGHARPLLARDRPRDRSRDQWSAI
eukprot:15459450-Alexandrium_andersonii.AAC.1